MGGDEEVETVEKNRTKEIDKREVGRMENSEMKSKKRDERMIQTFPWAEVEDAEER